MLPNEARRQVKHVATDNASPKLWAALRTLLPQLRTLTLDTVHLAMVYEYATFRRRTAGSTFLRAILARFSAHPEAEEPPPSLGPVFAGGSCREYNSREILLRSLLRTCSMSRETANRRGVNHSIMVELHTSSSDPVLRFAIEKFTTSV